MIKHVMENRFVLSVDYHDGMTTVTFPWDDSPACTDQANAVCSEDHVFYELALTYAYNHAFMYTGSVFSSLASCEDDLPASVRVTPSPSPSGTTAGRSWRLCPGVSRTSLTSSLTPWS